jgi:hypothetical protein
MEPENPINVDDLLLLSQEEFDAQEAALFAEAFAEIDTRKKLEKIETFPDWYGNPVTALNFIEETASREKHQQAIDELSLTVDLASAYQAKVQKYLNEEIAIDELALIDPRIPIHPIMERLLLSDNPKKTMAIRTIIFNAPKSSYNCPLNLLYDNKILLAKESHINDTFTKFLMKSIKPSAIPSGSSRADIGCSLTIFGYLINKLELPGPAKDQIFARVLSQLDQLHILLSTLSIPDLARFRAAEKKLELPQHLYEKTIKASAANCGNLIKRLGATYHRNTFSYNFEAPTPKRAAFDAHIRPIITELLPGNELDN